MYIRNFSGLFSFNRAWRHIHSWYYNGGFFFLTMSLSQSMMELMKKARKFSEPEARTYFLQIVTAVQVWEREEKEKKKSRQSRSRSNRKYFHCVLTCFQYLHSHGIIHRDLKLGNLFLAADNEIKIGDFGLATKISDGERKKTMCGTPNYMAPEIVERGKILKYCFWRWKWFWWWTLGTGHSFEVDVWALGVILYIFLIGRVRSNEINQKRSRWERAKKREEGNERREGERRRGGENEKFARVTRIYVASFRND